MNQQDAAELAVMRAVLAHDLAPTRRKLVAEGLDGEAVDRLIQRGILTRCWAPGDGGRMTLLINEQGRHEVAESDPATAERTMWDGPLPLTVPCPHCKAGAWIGCRTANGSGYSAPTHKRRWHIVGVFDAVPDHIDSQRLEYALRMVISATRRYGGPKQDNHVLAIRAVILALRAEDGGLVPWLHDPHVSDPERAMARLLIRIMTVPHEVTLMRPLDEILRRMTAKR